MVIQSLDAPSLKHKIKLEFDVDSINLMDI